MTNNNLNKLCPHCFCETDRDPCPECGFKKDSYKRNSIFLNMGSILNNRYQIGGVLGTGGFGITYLAYDTNLKRKVAVKEYFPRNFASRDSGSTMISVSNASSKELFSKGAEKFYDEACLVAQFDSNPNIVRVSDYFRENNTVYFTMELLEGQTLKDNLEEKRIFSPGEVVWLANGISNALEAAHSKKILHRDISPGNIMICKDGNVKLLDFGAARQFIAEGSQDFSVIFTPGYAPLEQYQRKGRQGPWTDIYSLGAMLYHALTLNTLDDPMSRLEDDSEFNSNVHGIEEGLWRIIKKATSMDITDRYLDVASFQKDINNLSIKAVPREIDQKALHFADLDQNDVIHTDTIVEPDLTEGDKTVLFIQCPHCGNSIKEMSAYCPACGKKINTSSPFPLDNGRKKILIIALIAVVCVIALVLFLRNGSDPGSDDDSSSQEISTEENQEKDTEQSDTEEGSQEEEEDSVDLSEIDINAVEDSSCSLKGMVQKKKNGSYVLKWKEGLTIYGLDIDDEKVLAREVDYIYIDDEDLESGILDDIPTNSAITISGDIYFDDDSIFLKADSLKDEEGNPIEKRKKEEKEEKKEKEEKPQPTADNSYIISNSDTVVLTRNDVSKLSLREINYAKNEIYARHGRLFQSRELQNYFNGKSWYHGTVAPENFSESMLSAVEQKNAALLRDVEFSIAPNGYQLDQ